MDHKYEYTRDTRDKRIFKKNLHLMIKRLSRRMVSELRVRIGLLIGGR